MGAVVIWKRDVAEEMRKLYKSPTLPELKGFVVELTLGDKILDILEKENDHVTPQRMVEDAQDACAKTVEFLNAKLKQLDAAAKGKTKDQVAGMVKTFDGIMKSKTSELGQIVAKIPKARWAKFVATKKQYKDYKIESGFKVTLGVLGMVGSGLAIAAAVPTGGASLALGIVGGVKSGISMAKLCQALWREMETIQKIVEKDLEKLKNVYITKGKKAGGREMLGTVLNSVIGLDVKASVPVCEKNVGLWSNKLAGVDVKGHEQGSNAMKVLQDCDKLEATLKKSNSKQAGKIMEKLNKLRPKLHELLEKTATTNARVAPSEKAIKIAEEILAELKKTVPMYATVFDKLFPLFMSLALAGANAGVGFTEATSVLDTANTSLGLANDVLGSINDAVD